MANFLKPLEHAYRIYSYFMAGLGLALILLIYLLHRWLEAYQDLP